MLNIERYLRYFKNIAVKHTAILHNPNSDDPNHAPGESYFAMFDLAEVFTQLKTQMGRERVSLLAHAYEWKGFSNQGIHRGHYVGGFVVVKHAEKNDLQSQLQARTESESVLHDIINKMIWDSMPIDGMPCNSIFGVLDLSNFKIVPIGPVWENHYGWHVEFSFNQPLTELYNRDNITQVFNP